jgi:hypothetical protein
MFKLARILRYLADQNTNFAFGVMDRADRSQLADDYFKAGLLVIEVGEAGFEMLPNELTMLAYRDA